MSFKTGSTRVLTVIFSSCLITGCADLPYQRPAPSGPTPEARVDSAVIAAKAHGDEPAYRTDVLTQQDQSTRELITQAEKSHDAGKWDEAVMLYQRVLQLDGENRRARGGLREIETERRHVHLLEDAHEMFDRGDMEGASLKLRAVLLENPSQPAALALKAEIDARQNADGARPKLKPNTTKPVTLEFRDANLKMVFEALSRTTGINFVLDKDIKPDTKTTVFVKKVPLEEALGVIFATNQLQKKILNDNTMLIYPNTPQKAKDYQELMIKSFYLVNADVKQTANLLRSMLKVRDIHTDERLNLLVLRDTPETVHLAEKLVALQDTAEPEVMLEVEVLEITRSKLSQLGVQFPNQLTVGSLGSNGSFSALTVEALKHLNGSNLTVSPNPALNFRKDDGAVDLLANPRIRVKNREKAKVQIGDRVPIITSNVTGTAATVSESVQYIDVGLKLEVEPVVNLDDYVAIKVGLEVSSLGPQTITSTGSVVYQIGTRNANTLLRLKDGETQILAGLINDSDRRDASKVPGLGDLPLVGRLFGTHKDDKFKTEIVLAITPHIINNIQRPSAEVMEFWSGTESAVSDKPFGNGSRNSGGASGGTVALPVQVEQPVPETVPAPESPPPVPELSPPVNEPSSPQAVPNPSQINEIPPT